MRRTFAALAIFAFALAFSTFCEIYSAQVTQTLCSQAQVLKQQAQAKNYDAANQTLTEMEIYLNRHQAGLEIFSQRTSIGAVSVCLAGLRAFLNEQNLPDLISEADRFCAQIQSARHLFFGVF